MTTLVITKPTQKGRLPHMSSATPVRHGSHPGTRQAPSAPTQNASERDPRDPLSDRALNRGFVELLEPHWVSAIDAATD